jgi:3-hydroxybutyryl-CoA dehydrogenase
VEVGIIGAGAMGRGIARAGATSGLQVRLYDVRPDAAEEAIEQIGNGLARDVTRGRTTVEDAEAAHARLSAVGTLEELAGCSLVIEAVVEDLAVKHEVFATLEKVVDDTCVLATNTSSLSVGSVFRHLTRPQRALGLHFFNPAHVMRLVEVIPGPYTDEATLTRGREFVATLGKTDVEAADSPGFVVNFAGRAYVTEALAVVDEGTATPAQVDRIMTTALGFPLGPFALMDLTGIDVNYPVSANLFEHNFGDPMLRSTWWHRYLYDAGLLGQKTGRGFHEYVDGRQVPSAAVDAGEVSADLAVRLHPADAGALADFCGAVGLQVAADDDAAAPILVAPLGEDCATVAARDGLDPRCVVGVDLALGVPDLVTLMAPPGADPGLVRAVAAAVGRTRAVEVIGDTAGFVAQRLVAAIVNLGCEMAQRRVATPHNIDLAVELGLRYPAGPLALGERYGLELVARVLDGLHRTLRDDRYRTSPWLRRRADLGLSAYEPDFTL